MKNNEPKTVEKEKIVAEKLKIFFKFKKSDQKIIIPIRYISTHICSNLLNFPDKAINNP